MRSSVYISIFFLLCSALAVNLAVDHFFSTPSVVSAPVYEAEPALIDAMDESPDLMDYVEYLMSGPSDRNAMKFIGTIEESSDVNPAQQNMNQRALAIVSMMQSADIPPVFQGTRLEHSDVNPSQQNINQSLLAIASRVESAEIPEMSHTPKLKNCDDKEAMREFVNKGCIRIIQVNGDRPVSGNTELDEAFEACYQSVKQKGHFYSQAHCNSAYRRMAAFCRFNPAVGKDNAVCQHLSRLESLESAARLEGIENFDWSRQIEITRPSIKQMHSNINENIRDAKSK
ncbi:hypothetical protein [Enterovibrio norvegicus]|uniref:Uncharacterized protein n=1 Tax=Enterovibrio norvegicus TaxID=188144 RepID=A0A2N7L4T6_9GAMM|nr:hypothetical protein [Enterovibrio norvegicus]PMN88331.1 hypothetical protein BCT23_07890 [Enterovibrio norvegicus]